MYYTEFLDKEGCVQVRKNLKKIIPQMIQDDISNKFLLPAQKEAELAKKYLFPAATLSLFIDKITESHNESSALIMHQLYKDIKGRCLMLRCLIKEQKTSLRNDPSLMVINKKNSEPKSCNSDINKEIASGFDIFLLLGMMVSL